MPSASVEVENLRPLVQQLRGPMFRQVNSALRDQARIIADGCVPAVRAAIATSPAPQAAAMADTVRAVRDRIPVVVVGKVNPRFASGFTRRGQQTKWGRPRQGAFSMPNRRGALAHGVVYGPLGGHRNTPAHENYYRISRDGAGGHLGRALRGHGPVLQRAADLYRDAFLHTMAAHGFHTHGSREVSW